MSRHQPSGSIRVLVVDDEPDFADMTATFLEREHETIEVDTATDAEEGIARLEDDRFDCVVSDYEMPGANGLEFFESVEETHPDVPFILFTGKGSEEIASRAISAGVTDYLQKTGGAEQYERLANRIVHATRARRAERELQETRAFTGSALDALEDIFFAFDEDGSFLEWNERVSEITGYTDGEIRSMHPVDFFADEDTKQVTEAIEECVRTGEIRIEAELVTKDGDRIPYEFRARTLGDSTGELLGIAGIGRDISERERREDRLAGLNEMLAEFLLADERQKICNIAVEAAGNRLDLPVTAIALFDEDEGVLRPAARTPQAQKHLDDSQLFGRGEAAWDVFASGEPAIRDDLDRGIDDPPSATHLLVYPLGKHGVFITAIDAPNGVSGAEEDFVETIVSNVKGALDRIEREELHREREELLEEQNEWLDRLNRINDVIRRIDRTLVGATTREEIEKAVCEELVAEGTYRFAWIGEYDSTTGRVEPRRGAGDEQGFLDALTVEVTDDATEEDPTARAVGTREPAVIEEVLAEPPLESWRRAALDRGFRSCMAIPLVYRDRLYGVLTVYAGRSNAFDELEREVLAELGGTIAHAINAIETTRALVSDEVVELEFEVAPSEIPFLEPISRASGCEIDLECVVPAREDTYRVFVTLHHADHDLVTRLEECPVVRACTPIADREEVRVVECTVTDASLVAWLLDHGAVPRSIAIDDRATVTVELSREADVRDFVELFRTTYPGTELVARRERERAVQTRAGFESEVEDRLTPRQQEMLRTAYFSGFFETPRERTGREIASSIGISQPTFSDHLRTALRKLLGMLYEDGSDGRRG